MINEAIIWQALVFCSLISGAVVCSLGWPARQFLPHLRTVNLGYALGVGIAVMFGMWWLGMSFSWPPKNHEQRVVELILPAVVMVELIIAATQLRKSMAWALRVLMASAVPGVLLEGHQLLQRNNPDLRILNIRTWNLAEQYVWLTSFALLLTFLWWSLVLLVRRRGSRAVLLALAIATSSGIWASYLAGYALNYRIGLPLVASLLSVWFVSWLFSDGKAGEPAVGIGVVGLFCVLMGAVFYTDVHEMSGLAYALPVLLSPLALWVSELPWLTKKPRWGQALLVLVIVPPLLWGPRFAKPKAISQETRHGETKASEEKDDWSGPDFDMSLEDLRNWSDG